MSNILKQKVGHELKKCPSIYIFLLSFIIGISKEREEHNPLIHVGLRGRKLMQPNFLLWKVQKNSSNSKQIRTLKNIICTLIYSHIYTY